MSIEQDHCTTILEALAMVQKVPVTGPIGEVAQFAHRIAEAEKAVHAYSDAQWPQSDQEGAEMLRAVRAKA